MTVPPFPSQDLAKLVLGYLAEEQLMTAYDEFLQASPYLDALRNEYDRIFMTSLKNILAEYRAVKIFVETCKPLILRKKLVQFTNLLDVVKFLAANADVNKIQANDTSYDKSLRQSTSKQSVCEVCCSLNLSSCTCKSKQKSIPSTSHIDTSLDTSLETTALEDLPGNHITARKKHAKADKDYLSESNPNENTKQSSHVLNNGGHVLNTLNSNSQSSQIKSNESSTLNLSSIVKATDTPECREKIEEFNTILKKVCNKSSVDSRLFSVPESNQLNKSISNASTFQDFASGVCGHDPNVPVPDSSTSDNSTSLHSIPKDRHTSNVNDLTKSTSENSQSHTQQYNYPYPRIKPKCKDQKIKIISDVKVDKPFPPISNATSTPLMQTIVINGTPAYKQKFPIINSNYTKDEIMAMPTIIVVPASGPPPHMTQTKPLLTHKLQTTKTKTVSETKILSPLVIDVSSSDAAAKNETEAMPDQPNLDIPKPGLDTGLVKTVDAIKNASVPKDNVISDSLQLNTPQVAPPVRKSSSTPRRNSHIRVLDFTTPRRILHETINEIVPETHDNKSVEIVVSNSPNLVFPSTGNSENNIVDMSNVKVHKIDTCHIRNITKDNDNIKQFINTKRNNWDADLRALALGSERNNEPPKKTKPKPRKPKKKPGVLQHETDKTDAIDKTDATDKTDTTDKTDNIDKKVVSDKTNKTVEKKPRNKRKLSPKPKKSKKRRKLEEEEELFEKSAPLIETKPTAKPNFNVVPGNPYIEPVVIDNKVNDSSQNKPENEEVHDTPEAERLCLQNEIGSRLNISEFLETPYKQVFYDIQMETPKFLGSVLSDEPISDIKIMSIPTPRFFDTPKPAQATPSSYSSRPTDYSSGGSYYKPDDQDYLRIPDIIQCPVTSSKEELPHVEAPQETPGTSKKSSRPVRKCTKNVSYSNAGIKIKEKVIDDKIEIASTCSDSISPNSSFENTKDATLKTPRSKSKLNPKSDSKKKLQTTKKRKTPIKKDKLNSFMKIKPRRPTPTKQNASKRTRRKTDVFSQSKSPRAQSKKKANSKEKNIHITPLIAPAPTKSRRKSSTPRKLHCTKTFNSESSGHESPDMVKPNNTRDQNLIGLASSHDSDTEQIALRWSDDGSQDVKSKEGESEDITKIKEYIETTDNDKNDLSDKTEALHVDLIKRGFDAETAKSIERDLLDPPFSGPNGNKTVIEVTASKKDESALDKSVETDTSVTNELHIVQDTESEDEFELSVYECHEDTHNYFSCVSEAKDRSKVLPTKLKDKFSMEVCIDDGVAIRLRATNFNMLFDNDPENEGELGYSFRETEVAVSSISNIDKLYTPMKDHKAQCYEIFDSTLTSLDTPLKVNSPRRKEQKITEIEIVLEEEKIESKDKADVKKRKRLQSSYSSENTLNESKKTKPEAHYLLNSTNIQNIDIESVLKKLHGP